MRFPTAERLLPEPVLPPAERERLRLKARGLVDDAITQYETYVRVRRRRLSRKYWKVVKRREGLTVYKERRRARNRGESTGSDGADGSEDIDGTTSSAMADADAVHTPSTVRSTFPSLYLQQLQQQRETSLAARETSVAGRETSSVPATPRVLTSGDGDSDARQRDWKLPGLLMVGTIVGTLEDVMYGVATFDAASMMLKTTLTHDELLDGEVLSQIRGPTPEDPFHFLGLKWVVKGNPPAVSKLVHPRDLVFLEATGIETRWNGERYGYHLMSSEDIDGCGPLSRKCGVLRGRLEMCVVYRQLPNGSVDVFMKALVDANGSVTKPVALFSAANGLSYCWRAVVCAQNKKLAWQLGHTHEKTRAEAELTAAMQGSGVAAAPLIPTSRRVKGKNACCAVCRKSAHAFRHLVTCELCTEPVCSRCKVVKKLSYSTWRPKEVATRDVLLCKRCVSRSASSDALAIARDEVLAGKWDQESDISIMPMPSRTSSSASSNYYYTCHDDGVERKPSRASASDAGFDRTLRLSLAQMELKENDENGSQSAPSFPIHDHLWGNSFDSTGDGAVNHVNDDDDDVDEEDQEYYFDEQGRASEVPRPSYVNSVARTSSFVDVTSLVTEYARASTHAEPSESVVLEVPTSTPTPTAASSPPRIVLYTAEPSAAYRADEKLRTRSASSPPELARGPIRSLSDSGSWLAQTRPSAPDLSAAPLPAPTRPGDHADLLKQMMMLRDAAEHVYLYTRHNSAVHTRHAPQVWPNAR